MSYVRTVMDNDRLIEVNPVFEDMAVKRGFYSRDLMARIADHGSVQDMDEVPEDVRREFVTAHDIAPMWHVRMQAAFQKHTDNAVSKTVNFSNSATPEDVREVYDLANELGTKGVTIYRDGSKANQVLTTGQSGKQAAAADDQRRGEIEPRPRPTVTTGRTEKIKTGCGNLYVTINADEQGLCEVFTSMGKSGGCAASQSEALSRMISMSLRAGVDPEAVVRQLRGIRCPTPTWAEGGKVLSCADAVGIALEHFIAYQETGHDADGRPQEHRHARQPRGRLPRVRELARAREWLRRVPRLRLLEVRVGRDIRHHARGGTGTSPVRPVFLPTRRA